MVLATVSAFAAVSIGAATPRLSAASVPGDLFSTGAESRTAVPGMLRTRITSLAIPLAADPGPRPVTVNLFDDASIGVTLERQPGGGPTVWTAKIPGRPGTAVLLVESNGYLFGNVHLGAAGEYTLKSDGTGRITIGQLQESSSRVEVGPVPLPASVRSSAVGGTQHGAPGRSRSAAPRVDVMIVWSAQVLDEEFGGDLEAGRAWAATRIAELDAIFTDSGVDAVARLAFAGTAAYDDGTDDEASLYDDLTNFTFAAGEDCDGATGGLQECDPEGRLDIEHTQRDLVGADIAILVVEDSDEYGIAWSNCRPGGPPYPSVAGCSESFAFAVVEFTAADGSYTLPHEVGHVLGATHDAANGGEGYARGYKVSGKFSTVLAYECSPGPADCATRVGIYSNPDVVWSGDSLTPMGEPIGTGGEADNASHFDLSTDLVAGFGNLSTCHGATPTILGTSGDDTIHGTNQSDIIMSFGGDDVITARGGADRVCGGGGDDTIDGGSGDDRLYGDAGHDIVAGGKGNDRLYGNRGDDALKGGGGSHDVLNGGPGRDLCRQGETNRKCETVR